MTTVLQESRQDGRLILTIDRPSAAMRSTRM